MGIFDRFRKINKDVPKLSKDEIRGKKRGMAGIWLDKGLAFSKINKYDEAIKCYDEALMLNPRYSAAWYNKGFELYIHCKHEEALKCFGEAIYIDPAYSTAWIGKADALRALNRNKEAVKSYDKAIRLDPRLGKAWYGKCWAMRVLSFSKDLSRTQEALKCYNKAIEIVPLGEIWYFKGEALERLGRIVEAEAAFAQATKLGFPSQGRHSRQI